MQAAPSLIRELCALAFVSLLLGYSLPAWAALKLCNDVSSPVNVAVAYQQGKQRHSQGWWDITPGTCRELLMNSLVKDSKLGIYVAEQGMPGKSLFHASQRTQPSCIRTEQASFRVAAQACGALEQRGFWELPVDSPNMMVLISPVIPRTWFSDDPTIQLRAAGPGKVVQGPQTVMVVVPESNRPIKTFAFGGGIELKSASAVPRPLAPVTSLSAAKRQACSALEASIPRPSLRGQAVDIAHYVDFTTLPQTRTRCTGTYDTGVPDPGSCTTRVENCAYRFLGACMPSLHTRCSNIIACNAVRVETKTMRCTLRAQFKLPSLVERPIADFFDSAERLRSQVNAALPLECVPPELRRHQPGATREAIVAAVTSEVQRRVQDALIREANAWLQEQATVAIAASIPSGGLAGAALMNSSVAQLVHRVHSSVRSTLTYLKDTRDLAEDLGFSTACAWSDWQ